MKKIVLIMFVAFLGTATLTIAGGKGGKKCCKKDSKECKEKSEGKAEEKHPEAGK